MNVLSTATWIAATFSIASSLMLVSFMNSPRKRRIIFYNMIALNTVELFSATCMIVLYTMHNTNTEENGKRILAIPVRNLWMFRRAAIVI